MTDDDLPMLDPDQISQLRALDSDAMPDMSKDVAELFLKDTPERLAELQDAFGRGDWKTAEDAAHSIKGSAGNFGRRIWVIAERIEAACREHSAERNELDGLASSLPSLFLLSAGD